MGPGSALRFAALVRDDSGVCWHTQKSPGLRRGFDVWRTERFAYLLARFLSAVPRMSPSVAPESEEPYCAMASFSSATSSALIDTWPLRAFLSHWITRAPTFL